MSILKINNIGNLSNTEFKIDGLTIISGENNTGKSMVCKLLYVLLKVLKASETSELKAFRIKEIHSILQFLYIYCNDGKHLDRASIVVKNLVENYNDVFDVGIYLSQYLDTHKFDAAQTKLFNDQIKEIKKVLSKSDEQLVNEYAQDLLILEFGEKYTETLFKAADSSIELLFVGGKIKISKTVEIVGESSGLNISVACWDNFKTIRNLLNHNDGVFNNDICHNRTPETIDILNKIDSVVGDAELKIVNGQLKYVCNEQFIELGNVAKGLMPFLYLKALNYTRVGTLILDEPESYLHPKWQIKLAETLALIQKLGVKVVVVTKSPYFIDALNLYAAQYNILRGCKFYKDESDSEKNTFIDVTQEIDMIYKPLADPFDTLETLRYELEEEGKLSI